MSKVSTLSPGLADEYSSSSTYEIGDYVLWQNAYWRCRQKISTGEPWDSSHWIEDDSPLPKKATTDPKMAAARAYIGNSREYAAADHVHPGETELVRAAPGNYSRTLPIDCFPITYTYNGSDYTIPSDTGNGGIVISGGLTDEFTLLDTLNFGGYPHFPEIAKFGWDPGEDNYDKFTEAGAGVTNLKFNDKDPVVGAWPVLSNSVAVVVRGRQVAKSSELVSVFSGQTMPATPTQNQLIAVVKQIFTRMGGTVVSIAAMLVSSALFAQNITPQTEWGDIVPTNTVAEVAEGAGLATTNYVQEAVGPKRIAMFIIPVNHETTGTFKGFELKASTSNFSHAADEADRLQFYAQSEIADTGQESPTPSLPFKIDRMKMYTCTSLGAQDQDSRAYTYVSNTVPGGAWSNMKFMSVVVLVDASCLVRHSGGDWLRDDNEDLMWCYLRNKDYTYEKEYGTDSALWRPIAPVRWFKELPNWTRQN